MFKVGEKVKVRSDLVVGHQCGGTLVTGVMASYAGQYVTIDYIRARGGYCIKEDGGSYFWSEEMFEEDRVDDPRPYIANGSIVTFSNEVLGEDVGVVLKNVPCEDGIDDYVVGNCFIYKLDDALIRDITKVQETDSMRTLLYVMNDYSKDNYRSCKVVWEACPVKEMTLAEIEKELGYKIKLKE